MTTLAMKDQIMAYLAGADDAQIRNIYALLKNNPENTSSSDLTNEQLDFLDKERTRHLNGESISYSWEQVKDMVRKRKAS